MDKNLANQSSDQSKPTLLVQAATFMCSQPYWAQKIHALGWCLCLIPPLGWLMALGFRKRIVLKLLHPNTYPLSETTFTLSDYIQLLRDGFCALVVMSIYFIPTLGLSWFLGAVQSQMSTGEIFLGFIKYTIASLSFPPLTLGGVNLYYQAYLPEFYLSSVQGMLIISLFILTTFILPLGYMQIGKRGKWRDALNLSQVLTTFLSKPQGYLCAWRDSLRLTLSAFTLGVHIPWGIIWTYQGIVWLFNQLQAEQFPNSSFYEEASPSDINLSSTNINSLNQNSAYIYRLGVAIPIWWQGDSID